jgi:hypothetical protein
VEKSARLSWAGDKTALEIEERAMDGRASGDRVCALAHFA